MEIIGGSCRFELWHVHVWWNDTAVQRVRFSTNALEGDIPPLIRKYCGGQPVDCSQLDSFALHADTMYSRIYREVRNVPYGTTMTYGEIAEKVHTAPRVVGQAMARNPTPLVIPCHRIVAAHGIGGFSPSVEIKEALLAMETKSQKKQTGKKRQDK
ncbi:MAG: methylated-DNA--[protein]-cysteine S-methyltransferase [Methanoregula sp.]|nr:methylated-DNA--[protein]-cysteine S-methyltransferase [Methanoregula sp.]